MPSYEYLTDVITHGLLGRKEEELDRKQLEERLNKLGAMPIGSSPQEFDAKIHADYDKWGPIIKAAGIKAE